MKSILIPRFPLVFVIFTLTFLVARSQQPASWSTVGNANLSTNCFIGTTDPRALVMKTNDTEQLKIAEDGKVAFKSLAGNGPSVIAADQTGTLFRMSDPGADSLFDCTVKLWKANGNFITQDCFIGSTNPQPFRMYTHNTERMRIATTGEVGVGTTDPKGLFQVGDSRPVVIDEHTFPNDTRRIIGFNLYLDGGQPHHVSQGPGALINFDLAYTDLCFMVMDAAAANQPAATAPMLAIDRNGRIGIGTRQQEALLHLYDGAAPATVRVQSGTGSSSVAFWAGLQNNPGAGRQGYLAADFNQAGNSELSLHVNPGGSATADKTVLSVDHLRTRIDTRVGIGTEPAQGDALAVNGGLRLTETNNASNALAIGHDGTDAYLDYTTQVTNANHPSRLRINGSGKATEFGGDVILTADVGIGTDSFDDASNGKHYRLSVDGKVRCREVKVNATWADHVFEPDYRLMPLDEVEAYIDLNGHLPGLPTAAEVEENGVELGAMQVKLLEKIEELTLHLIRLEKENAALKAQVSSFGQSSSE